VNLSMQEEMSSVAALEMTIEDIDHHLAYILERQKNHKPANTEIVDFWLDQRLEIMRREVEGA
jgi:hypothetical protein